MTARRLMVVLAGSFMLVPLALAQDRAVSRGDGGGGSAHSRSGAAESMGSSVSGGSDATPYYDGGSWSSQPQPVAFARDNAVSRGGGGSSSSHSRGGGSSSSSSGSSASSSRGGSSSSSSGSAHARGGSSSSSGSRHPKPATAAERRHPRAGTGSRGRGDGYYSPYSHGYPSYYPGWGWGSYWWPYGSYYDGWYGGGYWGYPYGGWGRTYVRRDVGSVRVLVDPEETRVYVDGYYAGTVDDFDGLFQRLSISPGRHEITLKLEGYKTHRMKVYVPFEDTLKLHYDMEKGSGETFADQAANVPESELQRERELLRARELEREQEQEERAQEESDEASGPATLRLEITPPDASVYVDGAFRGTARETASIQLPPGRHKIEVVRPGYRTVEREVETAGDEPTELTIELDKNSI